MSSGLEDILRLDRASFSYGPDPFVQGLDLSVRDGDFIALLGANGSGKSTLLKLLSVILHPVQGGVVLWDKPLATYRNRDRAKLMSFLPQTPDMNVPFTVQELASMGLYPYERRSAHGPGVDEALALVGLEDKRDSMLSELSGGEKRRAFIAMTLVQGAGVLLLDEPLANLDIRYQLELVRLLRDLNAKRRITILMAMHEINLALGLRRVLLVKEGALLADGEAEQVLTEPLLKEAFGVDVRVNGEGREAYISYGEGLL